MPETSHPGPVAEGTIRTLRHHSTVLGYTHDISVYLPPQYDLSEQYPVTYTQDGLDYLNIAELPVQLDRLIGEGRIVPTIVVMVAPPSFPDVNRSTEYGLNEKYIEFFTTELVPYIESLYPAIMSPAARLVMGDSYGGLISLAIALRHPEVFGDVASQSGYLSFQNQKLIDEFAVAPHIPRKIALTIGSEETNIGSDDLPPEEQDFLTPNRRLHEVLNSKGHDHFYHEFAGQHLWVNWKQHLGELIEYFWGVSTVPAAFRRERDNFDGDAGGR
jgi:enterochelin esterase-like enzyme